VRGACAFACVVCMCVPGFILVNLCVCVGGYVRTCVVVPV